MLDLDEWSTERSEEMEDDKLQEIEEGEGGMMRGV